MHVSMKIEKGVRSWSFYIIIIGIMICGFATISAVFSKQPFQTPFYFWIYQITAIIIPGLAYMRLLNQDENRGGVVCFFIAYALGYCSNIVWYYLLVIMGGIQDSQIAYLLVFSVQCIVCIGYLITQKVSYKENNTNWLVAILTIGVLFLIELFSYGGFNMLPPNTNGVRIWNDVLYWIGNSVSLKLDYPPVDFRTLNENYTYHYFSSISLAVESITTGIAIADLSIYFSYIQAIILVAGGLFCVFDKYIQKKSTMALFFFLALFTSGYEEITRVNYVTHMYLSQFGFDYGLGLMMFLLLAMTDFYEKEYSWQNHLFMYIIFAALMGTKSPFACIGIVGIGCLCLYFLLKKNWKKSFFQGMSILLIFILIYFFVCNMNGYSGGNVSNVVSVTTHHWEVSENLNNLRNTVFEVEHVPAILLEVFFWVLFVALCNPCLYALALVAFLIKVFIDRNLDGLDISCLIMIIVANSIALYIHMGGKSNTYFAMCVYPVVWVFLIRSITSIFERKRIVWTVVMLCLIIYGGNLFLYHNAFEPALDYWKTGRKIYLSQDEVSLNTEDGISQAEYDILQYARNSIASNEIIVKINEKEDIINLAGILAEHKVLNLNIQDILSDSVDLKDVMGKMNIEYLIVPCKISDNMGVAFEVVYGNEEWEIIRSFDGDIF